MPVALRSWLRDVTRPYIVLWRSPVVASGAPHEQLADGERGMGHALAPVGAVLRDVRPHSLGQRKAEAYWEALERPAVVHFLVPGDARGAHPRQNQLLRKSALGHARDIPCPEQLGHWALASLSCYTTSMGRLFLSVLSHAPGPFLNIPRCCGQLILFWPGFVEKKTNSHVS